MLIMHANELAGVESKNKRQTRVKEAELLTSVLIVINKKQFLSPHCLLHMCPYAYTTSRLWNTDVLKRNTQRSVVI